MHIQAMHQNISGQRIGTIIQEYTCVHVQMAYRLPWSITTYATARIVRRGTISYTYLHVQMYNDLNSLVSKQRK